MGMSLELKEAHGLLEQVDLIVSKEGMGLIKAGNLSRFNTAVYIRHEDGTTMLFENAYAVLFRTKIIMVFSEHNDCHVFHTEDLESWRMYQSVDIPNVPQDISIAAQIEPQDTLVRGIKTLLRLEADKDQQREIRPLILEWLRSADNPSFELSDKVFTHIDPNFVSNDWEKDDTSERRHGVEATVVKISNSHGLCYKVKYDDGVTGWFDPWELKKVN